MKKVFVLLLAALLCIFTIALWSKTYNLQEPSELGQVKSSAIVTIHDAKITAEIARTPEALARGLGGKKKLNDDEGMLFVFHNPTMNAFWMKDMLIAIDIVWVNNSTIIHIDHQIEPPTDLNKPLKRYYPPSPVTSVLETTSGRAKRNEVEIGDSVSIQY